MNKLVIIDGFSMIFRGYYGTAYGNREPMKNSKGIPINAVLTVNAMIQKIIREISPDFLFIALDSKGKTWRHNEYDEYKKGRSEVPEYLQVQIPIVLEMFEKMNIQNFGISGYEGDDVIASLAIRESKKNNVFIYSSDKDLLQLVGKNINVVLPQYGKNSNNIISQNNFREIYGINPNQIPDYKGLVGDSSDNLPGVKGIGPKGAIKLIEKYNKLENIYENISEIKSESLKAKLNNSKKDAFLSKRLANLSLDLEIPEIQGKYKLMPHPQEAIDFYSSLELNSLVNKYNGKVSKTPNLKEDFDNILI